MDAAALLSLDGSSNTATTTTAINDVITDYELSQIVIVPTSNWDPSTYGLGSQYDVYDGQQRLVTLNLLLASLRDSFRVEANELHRSDRGSGMGGGKRAVALSATAQEIAGMLMPVKVRKLDVRRITLRKRDDVLLEQILMGGSSANLNQGDDDDDDDVDEREDGSNINGVKVDHPATSLLPSETHQYPQMSTKQKSLLLSTLSPANARIFHNFVHLSKRLSSLSTRERLRLLDYIVERVHLLVCVPETSRIARNIVLNQQGRRKGMDNEPIDDFKGLVCFRYTLEEEDMYRTFDAWDVLAAENGSASTATSRRANDEEDGNEASVGREILSSACLLRASAALRTKIRSSRDRGGGDEVYELERWLRHEVWVRNKSLRSSSSPSSSSSSTAQVETKQQHEYWQGKDFFVEEIEPASMALYKFRAGLWDEFDFLSKPATKKDDSTSNVVVMTKKQRDTTIARLKFLRDIVLGVNAANEVETVVLEYLVRAEHDAKTIGNGVGDDNNSRMILCRNLNEILPLIEQWALWMAVTRPSSTQRQARIFALLDAMDDVDSLGSLGMITKSSTSINENSMGTSLRDAINEYEFGATAAGKRLAVAILKRLNSHLMIEEKKTIPDCSINDPKVESIKQSDWTSEEEREEWVHRIGNLAIISTTSAPGSRNSRGNKNSDSMLWEAKSKRYKKEPWVLTRQLAECDQWDVNSIQDQQKDILSLIDLVWSLE